MRCLSRRSRPSYCAWAAARPRWCGRRRCQCRARRRGRWRGPAVAAAARTTCLARRRRLRPPPARPAMGPSSCRPAAPARSSFRRCASRRSRCGAPAACSVEKTCKKGGPKRERARHKRAGQKDGNCTAAGGGAALHLRAACPTITDALDCGASMRRSGAPAPCSAAAPMPWLLRRDAASRVGWAAAEAAAGRPRSRARAARAALCGRRAAAVGAAGRERERVPVARQGPGRDQPQPVGAAAATRRAARRGRPGAAVAGARLGAPARALGEGQGRVYACKRAASRAVCLLTGSPSRQLCLLLLCSQLCLRCRQSKHARHPASASEVGCSLQRPVRGAADMSLCCIVASHAFCAPWAVRAGRRAPRRASEQSGGRPQVALQELCGRPRATAACRRPPSSCLAGGRCG
jgi:hypothetical protein